VNVDAFVADDGYFNAGDNGTLIWDPKVVENLSDEESKCVITG